MGSRLGKEWSGNHARIEVGHCRDLRYSIDESGEGLAMNKFLDNLIAHGATPIQFALLGIASIAFIAAVASCDKTPAEKAMEQQQQPSSLVAHAEHLSGDGFGASHSEHTRTQDDQAVNGFSYGNGFQITWQSATAPTAATPLDVLEAVQSRLLHMQKTKLGGDEIARALWDVNKAIENLSHSNRPGKNANTDSGGAGFN